MFTLTAVLALTEPAVALPVTVPCPRFPHWAPSQPTTTKLSKDKLGSTLVLLQCKVMVTLGLLGGTKGCGGVGVSEACTHAVGGSSRGADTNLPQARAVAHRVGKGVVAQLGQPANHV